MNHLSKIAAGLPRYDLDAMVISSEPGEFYAVGFHGEGLVLVTRQGRLSSTDSRYIEAVNQQVTGCDIAMIRNGPSHLKLAARHIEELGLKKIGFEEEYLSVAAFERMKKAFPERVE